MSIKHIFAVISIFFLGAAGWFVLGSASNFRSEATAYSLGRAISQLWGERIVQQAPRLSVKIPGQQAPRALVAAKNQIRVNLELEQRRKGLLWYPTFVSDFEGTYWISNTDPVVQNVHIHFPFPSATATYDSFNFWVDEVAQNTTINTQEGVNEIIRIDPGETRSFKVSYRTRGLWEWRYRLAGNSGQVRDLQMTVNTNFRAVDFPEGSLSPMVQEPSESGMQLSWQAEDLITRQDVAIVMPEKLNPGPLSARMSFFAPVCLLFFFVLISAIGIMKRIRIHPMHYLFVTSGFFAFHLLFAYLVDLINVHLAFVIASVTSVGLVIAYLAVALGREFPWKVAALGQLFYLVLFSYSFFLKGMTGLTVTIGSVLTLAMLMGMTAKLDWTQVFATAKPAGGEGV